MRCQLAEGRRVISPERWHSQWGLSDQTRINRMCWQTEKTLPTINQCEVDLLNYLTVCLSHVATKRKEAVCTYMYINIKLLRCLHVHSGIWRRQLPSLCILNKPMSACVLINSFVLTSVEVTDNNVRFETIKFQEPDKHSFWKRRQTSSVAHRLLCHTLWNIHCAPQMIRHSN